MNKQKLIIHVPHSSTHIPNKTGYAIDYVELNSEILKLTDWYTDELFSNESDIIIKAPFSRVFCDVERFVDDAEEVMSKCGMGVLYESLDDGNTMRTVTPEFKKQVIREYYNPHHQTLSNAVDSQLVENGFCIIVDAHSFPDYPLNRDLNKDLKRPDICIGTNSFHTPSELVNDSKEYFRQQGFSVEINSPYGGTLVPMKHYLKNKNVISIMLEINRKLYLCDRTNIKTEQFDSIKKLVKDYLNAIRNFRMNNKM